MSKSVPKNRKSVPSVMGTSDGNIFSLDAPLCRRPSRSSMLIGSARDTLPPSPSTRRPDTDDRMTFLPSANMSRMSQAASNSAWPQTRLPSPEEVSVLLKRYDSIDNFPDSSDVSPSAWHPHGADSQRTSSAMITLSPVDVPDFRSAIHHWERGTRHCTEAAPKVDYVESLFTLLDYFKNEKHSYVLNRIQGEMSFESPHDVKMVLSELESQVDLTRLQEPNEDSTL